MNGADGVCMCVLALFTLNWLCRVSSQDRGQIHMHDYTIIFFSSKWRLNFQQYIPANGLHFVCKMQRFKNSYSELIHVDHHH